MTLTNETAIHDPLRIITDNNPHSHSINREGRYFCKDADTAVVIVIMTGYGKLSRNVAVQMLRGPFDTATPNTQGLPYHIINDAGDRQVSEIVIF